MTKVEKIVSRATKEGQRLLYEAAASEFLLPSWEQVEEFLAGGPMSELPTHIVDNTPFTGPTVGRMIPTQGAPYVLIVTDGGREIVVGEHQTEVRFKTSKREASKVAAANVLRWLHQHTVDDVADVYFKNGETLPDGDISPDEL